MTSSSSPSVSASASAPYPSLLEIDEFINSFDDESNGADGSDGYSSCLNSDSNSESDAKAEADNDEAAAAAADADADSLADESDVFTRKISLLEESIELQYSGDEDKGIEEEKENGDEEEDESADAEAEADADADSDSDYHSESNSSDSHADSADSEFPDDSASSEFGGLDETPYKRLKSEKKEKKEELDEFDELKLLEAEELKFLESAEADADEEENDEFDELINASSALQTNENSDVSMEFPIFLRLGSVTASVSELADHVITIVDNPPALRLESVNGNSCLLDLSLTQKRAKADRIDYSLNFASDNSAARSSSMTLNFSFPEFHRSFKVARPNNKILISTTATANAKEQQNNSEWIDRLVRCVVKILRQPKPLPSNQVLAIQSRLMQVRRNYLSKPLISPDSTDLIFSSAPRDFVFVCNAIDENPIATIKQRCEEQIFPVAIAIESNSNILHLAVYSGKLNQPQAIFCRPIDLIRNAAFMFDDEPEEEKIRLRIETEPENENCSDDSEDELMGAGEQSNIGNSSFVSDVHFFQPSVVGGEFEIFLDSINVNFCRLLSTMIGAVDYPNHLSDFHSLAVVNKIPNGSEVRRIFNQTMKKRIRENLYPEEEEETGQNKRARLAAVESEREQRLTESIQREMELEIENYRKDQEIDELIQDLEYEQSQNHENQRIIEQRNHQLDQLNQLNQLERIPSPFDYPHSSTQKLLTHEHEAQRNETANKQIAQQQNKSQQPQPQAQQMRELERLDENSNSTDASLSWSRRSKLLLQQLRINESLKPFDEIDMKNDAVEPLELIVKAKKSLKRLKSLDRLSGILQVAAMLLLGAVLTVGVLVLPMIRE